jgi:transcriptional regulator with XRE-family HTH domain
VLRFLDQLAVLLNRRGLSPTAFGALVGVSHSTMGRIMQGHRQPDVEALDAWADALQLDGEERAAFILAGELANCPRGAVEYLLRLEADIAALRKRADISEALLDRLERRNDPAGPAPAPRSDSTGR